MSCLQLPSPDPRIPIPIQLPSLWFLATQNDGDFALQGHQRAIYSQNSVESLHSILTWWLSDIKDLTPPSWIPLFSWLLYHYTLQGFLLPHQSCFFSLLGWLFFLWPHEIIGWHQETIWNHLLSLSYTFCQDDLTVWNIFMLISSKSASSSNTFPQFQIPIPNCLNSKFL